MANTFYDNDMSRLSTEYNTFIAQAKNTNRRNGYAPSKEEYEYYVSASEVARKISAMNASQRAVSKQWTERAHLCEQRALELLKVLRPQAESKPAAAPAAAPDAASSAGAADNNDRNRSTQSASQAKGSVTTTSSGFTTRNASEDVSAETIEKWYKPMPDHGFDDIVGMDDLKQQIKEEILDNIGWEDTDDLLKISKLKSFLFYGPFGTGKSFFIEAIAKELMEKGFKFIQLSGADVHDSYVGVGEKVVRTAFQEAVDNAPCLLFCDEFENMCAERDGNSEGHEKRLSVAFMEAYNLLGSAKKPIVFLAATNYPDKIEHAMLSRINSYILVPLPSEEVREKYFNDSVGKLIHFGDDVDASYMADVTDNYSFRDLKKVSNKLKVVVKNMARDSFSVYDDDGNRIAEESDKQVSDAIREGKVVITKDLFDSVRESEKPEKKSDILASIEEFEKKI